MFSIEFSKGINEKVKNHTLIDNADFSDYRKHTEIIASEPLSKNVKNKGKLKVFTNNALIHATFDMNFTK